MFEEAIKDTLRIAAVKYCLNTIPISNYTAI